MQRSRTITFAAAAASLALTIPLHAQSDVEEQSAMPIAGVTLPSETLREGRFRILDLNGDEFLSEDEIGEDDPILRSQFSSLDTDNDGRLSKPEYVLNGRPPQSESQ